MNECIEKLLMAIEKNQFIDFLEGKPPYMVEMHQWVSADVPTNISKILTDGIYKVYEEKPELNIKVLFEEALLKMIDSEIFDLYMALIIVFDHVQSEEYKIAPFKINRQVVITTLRMSLNNHKTDLMNYFEWQGKGNSRGVWDEVIRIDSICKEDFGFSIIE